MPTADLHARRRLDTAVPEAGHTGGYAARPAEYERRVVGFFDRALLRS